ncbi:transposase [Streptomyces sp. NPDC005708]|uniref:transposase n=1 Tax=Streptomyces sp. NPDC005708 TaxID=3154564 RepID=UPI0033C0BFED
MHHALLVEQVFADLEDSALGHLPSGKFTANAAWLTLITLAHNLTRALGTLASTFHAKACAGTLRRQLIAVPARLAAGGRTLTFHLPERWPWQDAFAALWTVVGCRLWI